MKARFAFATFLTLAPGLVLAQQDPGTPMSAINWLSDSLATPADEPLGPAPVGEPAQSGAEVAAVTVTPLGADQGTRPDAIGLLAPHVTGLPADLWGASDPATIARRIAEERADMLPALQALLMKVLLAELDPPQTGGGSGQDVFLARIDKLLDMGAVEQAHAMLENAGPSSPEVVRRWFDAALLIGQEDAVCKAMETAPDLSPTYPARVFCLAREGDWDGAVLVMANARALREISEFEDRLLSRFLDPDLFEGEAPLTPPRRMTPLTFRLFEAIGEPVPTANLPRAFAQADLRSNIGWKAQVEAGERLARTGAVSDNQLVGLYMRREPAASGGVWERVRLVQSLDEAVEAEERDALARLLPDLWTGLTAAETEVPISRIYGQTLAGLDLPGVAGRIAFRMGLLTDRYEVVALGGVPPDPEDRFLAGVARGDVASLETPNDQAQAVKDGFTATAIPARFSDLVDNDRLGEAILRALTLFTSGTRGDYDELADAIALLRMVGLEDTARRAALDFLILERRG
ncbi:hypothetical protein [Maritimibacter sp. UBA3975]|uniref:hypothetical protein n=1 Tax=Maritimibacter sp. UBA3975 TaxID=1946833 RepID=UPI000C0B09BC|nr:hypothetical protein [Maritimibacter sp. UBA3975]MAM60591.1 hypothetical protein [Maritimibacter sp.]|tara:strand:- start:33525 stop:35084 length:1560 start_codon:yes stop_codon:yes gene_type:complete